MDDGVKSGAETNGGPITREELYDLVWAEPLTRVAVRFGVSDVAVAKWCRKLGVPWPGRGYWARSAAGYKVKKAALPPAKKGAPTEVARPEAKAQTGPKAANEEREPPPGLEKFPDTIVVPSNLDHPHNLVRKTRAALRRGHKDEYGLRHPRGDQTLLVYVSDGEMDRALRIMDGLVCSLERAGFEVTCSSQQDQYGRSTEVRSDVTIDGERVGFHLVEKRRRTERQPTEKERKEAERWSWMQGRKHFEYSSTAKLSLVVGYPGSYWSRGRISDGKATPLEAKLRQFVELLLWEAVRLQEERREKEDRQRREHEERLRREEAERRWREERRRRHHIERLAHRWRRSQEIRAFITSAETAAAAACDTLPAELVSWFEWARAYAVVLDPLTADGLVERLMGEPRASEDDEDTRATLSRVRSELERVGQGLPWRPW